MYCPPQVQKSVSDAIRYFLDHLEAADYYRTAGVTAAKWFGSLVEELVGANKAVTAEVFASLARGEHPLKMMVSLRQRQRDDARSFTDFVVSPHKSVSILGCVAGDAQVLADHQAAVDKTLKFLLSRAAVGVRTNGEHFNEVTGETIGASFLHDSSRPVNGQVDPLIHTHNILFNITKDKDGNWKGLENEYIVRLLPAATALYRSEMRRLLEKRGYEVDDLGAKAGFRVKGIGEDMCQKYSLRTRDIEGRIEKEEKKNLASLWRERSADLGRPLTAEEKKGIEALGHHKLSENQKDFIVHDSREKKLVREGQPISSGDVRQQQLGRLSESEKEALFKVMADAKERVAAGQVPRRVEFSAQQALDLALEHLTERASTFQERDLIIYAINVRPGCIDQDRLIGEIERRKRTGALIAVDSRYTTPEMLRLELEINQLVRSGKGQFNPVIDLASTAVPVRDVEGKFDLSNEQRAVIKMIWGHSDFAVSVRGLAGTGKTSGLRTAMVGLDKANVGWHVFGTTGAAVDALKTDGFPDADTVQGLLANHSSQAKLQKGDVVVLDEAGLLGTRQMHQFLVLCKNRECRVVLQGDALQLAPVGAGDALRVIEKFSGITRTELKQINRQRGYPELLEIARLASEHRAVESFDALQRLGPKRGGIAEITGDDARYEALAHEYLETQAKGLTAFIVEPTWAECDQVNIAIRTKMQAAGMLGKETEIFTELSRQLTPAEKKDARKYQIGDLVHVRKNSGQFAKGRYLVTAREGDKVTFCVETGGTPFEVDFSKKTPPVSVMDVAERRKLSLAKSDSILAVKGDRASGLANGTLLTFDSMHKDGTIIAKDDKGTMRELPSTFRAIRYGYAATDYKAQGKTVDCVFASIRAGENTRDLSRNSWYVTLTRARSKMKIFTNDAKALRESISGSASRESAMELVELKEKRQQKAAQKNVARAARARDIGAAVLRGIQGSKKKVSQKFKKTFSPTQAKSSLNKILQAFADRLRAAGRKVGRAVGKPLSEAARAALDKALSSQQSRKAQTQEKERRMKLSL